MNLREKAENAIRDRLAGEGKCYACGQNQYGTAHIGCTSRFGLNQDIQRLFAEQESALKAVASQGAQQGKEQSPALEPEIGLSLDMLDADRVRKIVSELGDFSPDTEYWVRCQCASETLRTLATNIETAVRDIGILRKQVQQRSLRNGTWEVEWSRDVVLGKDALLTDHPEGK